MGLLPLCDNIISVSNNQIKLYNDYITFKSNKDNLNNLATLNILPNYINIIIQNDNILSSLKTINNNPTITNINTSMTTLQTSLLKIISDVFTSDNLADPMNFTNNNLFTNINDFYNIIKNNDPFIILNNPPIKNRFLDLVKNLITAITNFKNDINLIKGPIFIYSEKRKV
jgi:hypothetical protein